MLLAAHTSACCTANQTMVTHAAVQVKAQHPQRLYTHRLCSADIFPCLPQGRATKVGMLCPAAWQNYCRMQVTSQPTTGASLPSNHVLLLLCLLPAPIKTAAPAADVVGAATTTTAVGADVCRCNGNTQQVICIRWYLPGLWKLRSAGGQKAGRWPPSQ